MKPRFLLTVILFVVALLPNPANADWLPFLVKNGHITIEVKISGQPAKAILDSGASFNVISKSFVKK